MKYFFIFLLIAIAAFVGWWIFKKPGASFLSAPTPSVSTEISATASPETSGLPDIVTAVIKTARGDIELELYSKVAPKTVLNFLVLAQKGFYDGTKFHRVVPDFVIQGGDPLSRTDDPQVGTGNPGYFFEDEINPKSLGLSADAIKQLEAAGYKYDYTLQSLPVKVGVIAMANAGPNTNGSQFFIVTTKDQPFLNGKHTVFGKVVKGMDVVRAIRQGDVTKSVNFKL